MFARFAQQAGHRAAATTKPMTLQQRFASKYFQNPVRENGQIPEGPTGPGQIDKWTMTRTQAEVVGKGIPIVFAFAIVQIPKNGMKHTYVQSDYSKLQDQLKA